MAAEKKFIRYTPAIDILYLKEVVAVNPFSDGTKWTSVVANLNKAVSTVRPDAKQFTERSIKERMGVILIAFMKEDIANLKKSGTEEEYNERDILLQEVKELKGESEEAKKEKKATATKKAEDLEAKGEEVRRKAMEGMSRDPTPTKKVKFDVGAYLERKNELEGRLKIKLQVFLKVKKGKFSNYLAKLPFDALSHRTHPFIEFLLLICQHSSLEWSNQMVSQGVRRISIQAHWWSPSFMR